MRTILHRFSILAILFAFACEEKEEELRNPVVKSLAPDRGVAGDLLAIKGQHFAQLSDVKVLFGSKSSLIKSFSDSLIEVLVPQGEESVQVIVMDARKRIVAGRFVYKTVPNVRLLPLEFVSDDSAPVTVEITAGSSPITSLKVVYSTSEIVDVSSGNLIEVQIDQSNQTNSKISLTVRGLSRNANYFIRAFATSADGDGVSNQENFKTNGYSEWFPVSKVQFPFGVITGVGVATSGQAGLIVVWGGNSVNGYAYYPVECAPQQLPIIYDKFPGASRHNAVLSSIGDKFLYGLGNTDTQSPVQLSDLWLFNRAGNEWVRLEDLPTELHQKRSFVVNNQFYVLGNVHSGFSADDKRLYKYSYETDSWQQLNSPLQPVSGISDAFAIGERAYAVLKSADLGVNKFLLIEYDINSDNWIVRTTFPPTGSGTLRVQAYGVSGKAIIMIPDYGTIEYTQASNQWRKTADRSRIGAGAFVENEKLFVVENGVLYCYVPNPE